MKKVLVRSLYREPVVKVGEVAVRNHQGVAMMAPTLRAFRNYLCYMTPEEADFLVDSPENRKMRAEGKAPYFYPAGFPAPVDINYEGPLPPAVSAEGLSTSADPSSALAAKAQMERAEVELTAREKGAGTEMDRQFGKQPAPAA
jgi:hypothetical protein